MEVGAFPTSYIPTSGSQVTRSADAASMTGTNFSDWYRQDEGTLYAEAQRYVGADSFSAFISLNDTTISNEIFTINATSSNHFLGNVVSAAGDNGSVARYGSWVIGDLQKGAMAYAVNDIAGTTNGLSVSTDSSAHIPHVTQAQIGYRSGTYLNGTIKKLAYYPARLTNAELQALTEE